MTTSNTILRTSVGHAPYPGAVLRAHAFVVGADDARFEPILSGTEWARNLSCYDSRVVKMPDLGYRVIVDLEHYATETKAGFKFQFFDSRSIPADGYGVDNVRPGPAGPTGEGNRLPSLAM